MVIKSYIMPVEFILLAFIVFAGIFSEVFSLKFYYPNVDADSGILSYFSELTVYILYFLIPLVVRYFYKIINSRRENLLFSETILDYIVTFRLYAVLVLSTVLMQHFKLWSLLIHDSLYDNSYYEFDKLFFSYPILPYPIQLERLYITLYGLSFILSIFMSTLRGRDSLEVMVTAISLTMLIGGAAYMIAPAYGPFIFYADNDSFFYEAQNRMLEFSESFRNSNGRDFTKGDFESPLGAMPSLHVAQIVVIAYFITKHKYIGLIFWCVAGFISFFSIVTQFHYLVDGIAGLIVAYSCIFLTEKLLKKNP